ncbi:hypothetical protein CPB84DRAFT_1778226 [Gymnopilus junonius]|uniref:Uncharacterized protein n=1 Tax=Gymnopilus junonius TaxID=109634 RepID=A0A9P5NL48_GYMJU|nr:hypothetical protein CPB84DRAFT_1778226 [Gymnopilus junonius]
MRDGETWAGTHAVFSPYDYSHSWPSLSFQVSTEARPEPTPGSATATGGDETEPTLSSFLKGFQTSVKSTWAGQVWA